MRSKHIHKTYFLSNAKGLSRDQTAGRSQSIKIDNSSFERVRVQIFGNNLKESKF
jgi:hypothetical protein